MTEAAAPAPARAGLGGVLLEELRPYEGRLFMALHIAALCGATAVIAMVLRMPEALVACYLIFFAYKDNAGEGIVIGAGLIVAATVAIGVGVLLLAVLADAPGPRLATILALTFAGMFLWRASAMGPASYALAFVLAFVLMLADTVPAPELLVRAMTWLWVVVAVPMGLLVLSNILFGRSPAALARRVVAERLAAAAQALEGAGEDPARLLEEGNAEALGYVKMAGLLGELRGTDTDRMRAELDASHRILRAALAEAAAGTDGRARAAELRALAEGAAAVPAPAGSGPLSEAIAALGAARDPARPPRPLAPEPAPFFKPDAFSNPAYVQFALKVALAVAITYVLVLSIELFDIHTAMVTCFFVALGTGGETFHKSSLRLAGCLIGAAMGWAATVLIVPHLTDIGHLFAVIAGGSFLAAWVSLGTWRTQYLGWQMALAFFICVLPGSPLQFGPNTELADAGYRILGILLGISVMGLIFALIWPESAEDALARETAASLRATAATLRGADRGLAAQTHLGAARLAAEVMVFERLGAHLAGPRRQALLRRLRAARGLARLAPALAGRPGAAALADEIARAAEAFAPGATATPPAAVDPAPGVGDGPARADARAAPRTEARHAGRGELRGAGDAMAQARRLLRALDPRETQP
ncbi:MAG: FUSC family protein [Alkalilacustris sp.]